MSIKVDNGVITITMITVDERLPIRCKSKLFIFFSLKKLILNFLRRTIFDFISDIKHFSILLMNLCLHLIVKKEGFFE